MSNTKELEKIAESVRILQDKIEALVNEIKASMSPAHAASTLIDYGVLICFKNAPNGESAVAACVDMLNYAIQNYVNQDRKEQSNE